MNGNKWKMGGGGVGIFKVIDEYEIYTYKVTEPIYKAGSKIS